MKIIKTVLSMTILLPSISLSNPLMLTESVAELYIANNNFNVANAAELEAFLLSNAGATCIQTPELVRDSYQNKNPTNETDEGLYKSAKNHNFGEVMVYLEAKRYIALGGRSDAVCQEIINGGYKRLSEITKEKIKEAEKNIKLIKPSQPVNQ